ncbi:MAG TPA: hypothetical protein VGE56_00785 [Rhodocyclaceae bacterium]
MWIIVLTISLQYGITVDKSTVENRNTRYTTQASCEKRAAELVGPLPVPTGYSAKWQSATCKKV